MESAVVTPEWSKGAVWYQIFPERFRNGDPENDPTKEEVNIAESINWEISSWTSGWYTRTEWEKKTGPSVYDGIYRRMYGGDLQGVIEKLDYLTELGVTAIYFNPLFEAPSLHKYDASSFHHIDNNFGRDSKGDLQMMEMENNNSNSWGWSSADSVFLELLEEAHKRDIRIIIDGVFNHTGRDFWAFKDLLKNGEKSAYANWYMVTKWDDPATPQNEMEYSGWWGHSSLPEFREDKNGIVKEVREYIWQITKRWMDPNGDGDPSDGVDGWRLDAVPDVSKKFWSDWCSYTRTINPDVYLVAEIWFEAQDYMSNTMFNSVLNYPFAKEAFKFFINQKTKIPASEFAARLTNLDTLYNRDVTLSAMTLMGSHDTERMASMILNPDRPFDKNSTPKDSAAYNVSKPGIEERKIQVMIAALQATFPGAPLIYYGDEAGMWGADDPDDRKPMLWDDLVYEDEEYSSLGKDYPADKVKFDPELFNIYKTLFSCRKKHRALRLGDFKIEITDDQREILGFSRTYMDETVFVYFNRSTDPHKLRTITGYEDLLGNHIENNELLLPARSAAILVK